MTKKITVPKIQRKKPIDWFCGPANPVQGEQSVWIAVITQAMMDALTRSTNSDALFYKHEAMCWLMHNSKDFILVCQLAGLDPDYVRVNAKKALITPRPWRAEAGKGKRYLERKAHRTQQRKKGTTHDA